MAGVAGKWQIVSLGWNMFFKSSFAKSLRKAVSDLPSFTRHLGEFENHKVAGEAEAKAVVEALNALEGAECAHKSPSSPYHVVIAYFQDTEDREAIQYLRQNGIPRLIRILEARWNDKDLRWDLMFCFKILAMYQTPQAVPLIVRAMREWPEEYLWRISLQYFAEKDAPQADLLIRTVGEDIPRDAAGVAYLECVNARAREYGLSPHPFSTPSGIIRLKELLTNPDPQDDNAISATAALPFLPRDAQSELFSLALDHPNWEVQLEAAWAMAKIGNERGFSLMVDFAKDVHKFIKVARYLHELGRDSLLPSETLSEDFQAMAEMSNWLQHPSELGRIPDELIQVDTRELCWPPTNDTRRVWLFRYTCKPPAGVEADENDTGIGMVGSVTWVLFSESTANMKPEDVYALHCCWELQQNDDELAPGERDVQTGLSILRKYNPGM